jgi:hypothetical protein
MTSNNKSAHEQFEAGEIDANTLSKLVNDMLTDTPSEEDQRDIDRQALNDSSYDDDDFSEEESSRW